jgi:ubiquinone biosynthesis protein
MANPVSSALRLVAAGWVLAHHDALTPREVASLLPPPIRYAGAVLRLLAGGAGAKGRPGERLARAFERMGPATIKLGQLLSTRADIFGAVFADDLNRLKDRLPPFPLEVARTEIAAALGRPVESLFASIDPPIAAASIAQAHPAMLLDGRKVAVKVLRPGIEKRIAKDVAAMALGAAIVERLAPQLARLEPRLFTHTVSRSLELETDLRLEAAAASEMGEVMALDPYMQAPKVVWDGVNKRVLTLEWVRGVPLSAATTLDLPGLDRPTLANNVIRAFLTQALDHGVFHADLHEGNLFVEAPAGLFAVDFGIVGRLGPKERRFLAEILWGFIRRDYRRVAEVHFEAGYVPAIHDVAAFAQALRAVGEPIFGRKAGDVSMGRLLGQLFEITALFDMHLRPELVLLQKTMVTVEGVARRIDSQNDIWAAAKPVVERWISRELSPVRRLRDLADQGVRAVESFARWAETAPTSSPPAPAAKTSAQPVAWIALGISLLAAGAAAYALLTR